MESLPLKIEHRNKLYFNKHRYKASILVNGIRHTYYTKSIEDFKHRIDMIKTRLRNHSYHSYRSVASLDLLKSIKYDIIEKFIDWRNLNSKNVTIRMEGDYASIFSNNLSILKELGELDENLALFEVSLTEKDVIFFKKDPKFKFRVYIKPVRATQEFIDNMIDFMGRNSENKNLSFSNAFKKDVEQQVNRYMHGSYYIEYNEESTLSLLYLLFPKVLGKNYRLLNVVERDKYSNNMEYLDGQDN